LYTWKSALQLRQRPPRRQALPLKRQLSLHLHPSRPLLRLQLHLL
jgi:hypothetical protein